MINFAVMNNPFDYVPGEECQAAFRELLLRLERLQESGRSADVNFCRELAEGKMLGVLIAEDSKGVRHRLFAFSGQIGDAGFHFPGFVGPVIDYLQPEGYFKIHERKISRQNEEISRFEKEVLAKARDRYEEAESLSEARINNLREKYNASKRQREERRESGKADESELAEMIRQSQFEKAELRRLKGREKERLLPFAEELARAKNQLQGMKEKRKCDSERLQSWLFTEFRLLNAAGEWKSLRDIFAETPWKIPPSGAGECCAPKLLQAAYLKGWTPIEMAEYWYGKPKGGEVRRHGEHYPACRGKCLPVLSWMLRGLEVSPPIGEDCRATPESAAEVIYETVLFCVVSKPSGMLSVPGKGKSESIEDWLKSKYPDKGFLKMAHRLDQDTSGLMIAAFTPDSYKELQAQFALRKIEKEYEALLDGDYKALDIPPMGRIELPLSADILDRPRQYVDFATGKEALTEYEFIGVEEGRSRVVFRPRTGRTHHLRIHAASEPGLGMPIVGDRLYGKRRAGERLHLHARRVEFDFPLDGRHYSFEVPAPF